MGLSRNNLPPQKKKKTHTTTKITAKASSPAKSGNVPRRQCRPVVLHCRTVRPNPHTLLIPNRPRLQLPQYRTNTALCKICGLQGPKRAYKEIRKTKAHTQQGFLSFYDALLGLRLLLLLLLRRRHHRRKRRAPIHRPKKKNLIQFQSSDLKCTQNRAGKDKKTTPLDP